MGTRAALGWITPDGEVRATYSQYDGYPKYMGVQLQSQVHAWSALPTIEALSAIRLVDASNEPTPEEAEKFKELHENVSTGKDWYATLRGQQGRLDLILKNGIMTDDRDFPRDSLFCEWAYLIDTRSAEMVILMGFNTKPDQHPDYLAPLQEDRKVGYYYPCREIWRGSLEAFLALDMTALEAQFDREDEDAA